MNSLYLRALTQTPLSWQSGRGILGNILDHLGRAKMRGDRWVSEAYNTAHLVGELDPHYKQWRLQRMLQGRPDVITHPLDQFLSNYGKLASQQINTVNDFTRTKVREGGSRKPKKLSRILGEKTAALCMRKSG